VAVGNVFVSSSACKAGTVGDGLGKYTFKGHLETFLFNRILMYAGISRFVYKNNRGRCSVGCPLIM